ncbi:MAG: hypothetical protein K0R03_651 [Moraxellaceae bacterium]|jgi:hypothetical protein|nr:hypothetical protein [Moraxellaceae bacterium]
MMAGYDNYNDASSDDRNLSRYLWLGAIETLINAFIDLDAPTRERVTSMAGLVVRVKVVDPYLPFYLFFTREGIEVCEEAPYPAQVRVNARLFDMVRTLLGAAPVSPSGRTRVRVWGEAESVAQLESLLIDYNLRTRAQEWLRGHLNLESLWQKIRNHDPSWLKDFMPLPSLMRETLNEIRLLNQNLNLQQLEFERFRKQAHRQRTYDLVFLSLVFLALMAGLTEHLSAERLAQLSSQQVLMLCMAALMLLSRLRS